MTKDDTPIFANTLQDLPPPRSTEDGKQAFLFDGHDGKLVEYKCSEFVWNKESEFYYDDGLMFKKFNNGDDEISVRDFVSTEDAPEPPEDSDMNGDMHGQVLAVYSDQALVDFGEDGEHYVPKSWLSKEKTGLAGIIDDMWPHANLMSMSSDRVEFKLYGADYEVVKDPPGVTVHSYHNTSKIIEDAINYVYDRN